MTKTGSFNNALPIISLYVFAGYRLMPALQQTYASLTQLTFVGPSLDALTNDIKNLKPFISKQDEGVLSLKKSIIMKNISYSYPNSTRTALKNIDVIITTGGTGLTGRDITPEAIEEVADKHIPGFGEIFRNISLKTVGTSAIQSRACAVLANGKYIFALPGSSGGVTDAWDGILKHQLDINHKPCNFVELFPRLKEK